MGKAKTEYQKSIFYFHCDEPVIAWRTIGVAARIALEMGLHRRESLEVNFPDRQKRQWAVKLFWGVYILDRRWSFNTGIPFTLQDTDIDPHLPYPVNLLADSDRPMMLTDKNRRMASNT